MIVHCHAGVSRSSAIAISFAWFNNDTKMFNETMNSKKYVPNAKVMELMAKEIKEIPLQLTHTIHKKTPPLIKRGCFLFLL